MTASVTVWAVIFVSGRKINQLGITMMERRMAIPLCCIVVATDGADGAEAAALNCYC